MQRYLPGTNSKRPSPKLRSVVMIRLKMLMRLLVPIAKGSSKVLKSNSKDKKPWRQSFLHRHDTTYSKTLTEKAQSRDHIFATKLSGAKESTKICVKKEEFAPRPSKVVHEAAVAKIWYKPYIAFMNIQQFKQMFCPPLPPPPLLTK